MALDSVVAASAPGKVLLVGAYLVVEPPDQGLVLATNARFYAIAQPLIAVRENEVTETAAAEAADAEQKKAEEGNAQRVSGNPYVERVVQVALGAALGETGGGVKDGATDKRQLRERLASAGVRITIAGDNDFYSHRHTVHRPSMHIPPCTFPHAHSPMHIPPCTFPHSHSPMHIPPFTFPHAHSPIHIPPCTFPHAHSPIHIPPCTFPHSHSPMHISPSALLRFLRVLGGRGHGAADEGCQERAMGSGAEEGSQEESVGSAGTVGREEVVHRVAQVAHCLAQGKAGSGFDVAAGVFGSMCYQRFNPAVMHALMGAEAAMTVSSISATLRFPLWDHTIAPLHLPPGLLLVLGEPGTGGTATPSMLSAVMKWRKQSPEEAEPIWEGLKGANAAVAAALSHLSLLARTHPGAFSTTLNHLQHVPLTAAAPVAPVAAATQVNPLCATNEAAGDLQAGTHAHGSSDSHTSSIVEPHAPQQPQEQQESLNSQEQQGGDIRNTILHALLTLRSSFLSVRHLLSAMGAAAATPIEPPQQTALLDATMQQPGVVMAGVPGAGGFDSVFAVVVGEEAARRLDGVWAGMGVMQMGVRSGSKGMMWEEVEGLMRMLGRG
ncbi:unnamed protein product [Closterium sp. Naga37s-1]|nr:unnamed protein product [Closterium sp. Naga37s-1]